MYHSFFTAALLVASNVLVQAQDPNGVKPTPAANTNPTTPAGNPVNPVTPTTPGAPGTTIPGANPQSIPHLPGITNCTASFLPFSQRELAEMAMEDNTPGNNVTIPDPKTLSNAPVTAFCKRQAVQGGAPELNAVCVLSTCATTVSAAPECNQCYELIPNTAGGDDTLGTTASDNVICDGSYNFNSTDTKTPFVCQTVGSKTYSCNSCLGSRACTECTDMKDLSSGP